MSMIENFLDRVICGDALTILKQIPSNSINMGVTSPPYNKRENKKGWLVNKVIYKGATDNLPEDKYQEIQVEVLNELYRVIKPGGSFFYNHKIRWERGEMLHPIRAIYSIMDERKGGIIIDPYCGSGTTLVAAKVLGHHYIGIDISEEYVGYAIKRLGNYKKEIPIAMEEISKHIVRKSFKERKERGEFVGKHRKGNGLNNKKRTPSLFESFDSKNDK